jgi:predicted HTH domain antitoxin
MTITIPDEVREATRMSEDELRQEFAVLLYQREKLTLIQAARLAGMDRYRFQHLLGSRGIDMEYDVEDYRQDMATLRDLGRI